jgi:hypothetical protein
MSTYLVLYNASTSAREQMAQATPEQAKAGMDAWMQWAQRAGEAVLDLGAPLQHAARVSSSGASSAGSDAAGYSILQAGSLQELTGLLEDHPHLHMPGASIDVLETLPVPGM